MPILLGLVPPRGLAARGALLAAPAARLVRARSSERLAHALRVGLLPPKEPRDGPGGARERVLERLLDVHAHDGVGLRVLQLLCVLQELPNDFFVRARGEVRVERLVVRAARDDAVAADAVDGGEREVEGPVEREEARGRRELVCGVAELGAVLFQVVIPGLCAVGFE